MFTYTMDRLKKTVGAVSNLLKQSHDATRRAWLHGSKKKPDCFSCWRAWPNKNKDLSSPVCSQDLDFFKIED